MNIKIIRTTYQMYCSTNELPYSINIWLSRVSSLTMAVNSWNIYYVIRNRKLTLRSWALLEKRQVAQLLKNCPKFCVNTRFIIAWIRALHCFQSWARSIQSIHTTQHNRKRRAAPWSTRASTWDYNSNIGITKQKHSSFHQQFYTPDDYKYRSKQKLLKKA
jgi:hypothetical protein